MKRKILNITSRDRMRSEGIPRSTNIKDSDSSNAGQVELRRSCYQDLPSKVDLCSYRVRQETGVQEDREKLV